MSGIFSRTGTATSTNQVFTGPFCVPAGVAQAQTITTTVSNQRLTVNALQPVIEKDLLDQFACITLDSGALEVRRITRVYTSSNEIFLDTALSGAATATAWTVITLGTLGDEISVTNNGAMAGTLLGAAFPVGQSEDFQASETHGPIYGDASTTSFLVQFKGVFLPSR